MQLLRALHAQIWARISAAGIPIVFLTMRLAHGRYQALKGTTAPVERLVSSLPI